MCNCSHSQWLRNAKVFHYHRGNFLNEHWHTIDFLLSNGHCGLENRIDTGTIVRHLRSNGFDISREEFKHTILADLKQMQMVATLVSGGRQGGVFIPCHAREVREAARQMLDRVITELLHLEAMAAPTAFGNKISRALKVVELTRGKV
ncbi:MAG: hypothetical protein JSV44_00250 [Candidatus Zixiibacteriota bacterium]|nr:MAG: hypothetical protein JSV44_00250 [candidate division Zixibacteria bacterium]